jgi:hypothetical protein
MRPPSSALGHREEGIVQPPTVELEAKDRDVDVEERAERCADVLVCVVGAKRKVELAGTPVFGGLDAALS